MAVIFSHFPVIQIINYNNTTIIGKLFIISVTQYDKPFVNSFISVLLIFSEEDIFYID